MRELVGETVGVCDEVAVGDSVAVAVTLAV